MGQQGSSDDGSSLPGIVVVKPAPSSVPYTAYSIPRDEQDSHDNSSSGQQQQQSQYDTQLRIVLPLIEGSQKGWAFRPSGSTEKLPRVDCVALLELQSRVQSSLHKTSALVECGQHTVTHQMRSVERQLANANAVFVALVASRNRDLRAIGELAEQLAQETRSAYNRLAKLVDLTAVVKKLLPEHDREQVHHGSALYRASSAASRSGGESDGELIGVAVGLRVGAKRRDSTTATLLLSPQSDSKLLNFWMEIALPRWNDVSDEKKLAVAKRGIPGSIRGEVWKRAIGNKLGLTKERYEACGSVSGAVVDEAISLIRHDVPRTFNRLGLFVNPQESFTTDLVAVLETFVRANTGLGYVQGLSYLAGMLLLNMSTFDAWVCLNNFVVGNHLFTSILKVDVTGIVKHARNLRNDLV